MVVVGEGVMSALARKRSQVIPGASVYMRQGYVSYRRCICACAPGVFLIAGA
jgi:hypothetical protein